MNFCAEELSRHVHYLTDDIGVRLPGSKEELLAAEYIASEFRKYSDNVSIYRYPVMERCVESELLEVEINGCWEEFPCSLFISAPSTGGKTVEAELVFFDTATGYQRPDLSYLRGKAVVHLGCHIENENDYRRLMESQPAFILFIDTRYTGNVQLADGLFPAYVKKYGAVTSLNVAYMSGWKWLQEHATRARICVSGELRESQTSVVVCDIPGTDPSAGVIYAGGHHDTQSGTVGADDNAIGSACVIELARQLSQKPHKSTYRLISFGAEENLSVGSSAYVREFRSEVERDGVFMCNFDSMGSALGWAAFTVNANDATRALIKECFNKRGIYYVENLVPCPYTDQFPFAACGVAGFWQFRQNCESGVYFHHRIDNTPDKLDFEMASNHVAASCDLLDYIANCEDNSVYRGIPDETFKAVSEQFQAVYGGF